MPSAPGMPSVGGAELLMLVVVVLLLFGAKRIPGLARAFGSGIREFREGMSGRGEVRGGVWERARDEKIPVAEEVRGDAGDGSNPRAERVERGL